MQYKEVHIIIQSIRESVKANGYGKASIKTLDTYFNYYEKYCSYLNDGATKMEAYEWTGADLGKSAEVVRRAVKKIDNLICEPFDRIKETLNETSQTSLSMNKLAYYWEVFNKYRVYHETYRLKKMEAYKQTALFMQRYGFNANCSVKHVRDIVKTINDIINEL